MTKDLSNFDKWRSDTHIVPFYHYCKYVLYPEGNIPAEDKLWVFGTAWSDPDVTSDLTHEDIKKSTEYVFANGTVTLGPSMPYHAEEPGFGNTDHCLVGLIGGDIMIMRHSSVQPHEARVYRYNPSSNIYTRLEKLQGEHALHFIVPNMEIDMWYTMVVATTLDGWLNCLITLWQMNGKLVSL